MAFAWEKIIGDFRSLSRPDKERLVETIGRDRGGFIDEAGLMPLVGNIRQLVAALADLGEEELSKKMSTLMVQRLLEQYRSLDSETHP
jgi:hypothetical protein